VALQAIAIQAASLLNQQGGYLMKLRSIALAAALAASSIPAFALTTDIGQLDGDTAGFGNAFPAGAFLFSDTFTFSLASAQTISGVTFWGNITTFGLQLVDGNGDEIAGTLDTTPASFSYSLAAGSYGLNFIGAGAGAGSGYGGNVTAVPEPETYALMLAGLGIIGFIGARRRERS
jgi:hypothetical protein